MAVGPQVVSCDALLELSAFIVRLLYEGHASFAKGAPLAESTSAGSAVTGETADSLIRRRKGATHRSVSCTALIRTVAALRVVDREQLVADAFEARGVKLFDFDRD